MTAANDPTRGMERDYAEHDEYQRAVAGGALSAVALAARRAAAHPAPAFSIVDYGCATSPHADLIRAAIDAVRDVRGADAPVVVVHNDLPGNDWNALFAAATDAQRGYVAGYDPPPLPMASAASFFGGVVPPRRASLGISFSAAHWLRVQPQLDAGAWCFCHAHPAARARLAAAAANDWETFLRARAQDLAAGGMLVVECIGRTRDGDVERVTAHRLLAFMREIALELADDGRLAPSAVERFVFPTYARDVEEALKPVQDGGLGRAFAVVEASVREVPNPYADVLRASGPQAYAAKYAAYVRAFAASTLLDHVFTPGAGSGGAAGLLDAYFDRFRDAVARDPERGVFEDWTLRVVLERQEGDPQ